MWKLNFLKFIISYQYKNKYEVDKLKFNTIENFERI